MKLITKIQSISDLITNSSSEVFLMHSEDADYYANLDTGGCVDIYKITWDWLEANTYEWEMVCSYLNIDYNLVSTFHDGYYGYWETPTKEKWEEFLNMYKDLIDENLIGLYFVEIEDHFPDAYEITEEARGDCLWSESRH